jgi:acyl-ACP thioesterase
VALTELAPAPTAGRVFTHPALAGLGDVAPSGRVRLDTLVRWLQDAAYADLIDSGLPDDGVWVVRRLRLRVERFPQFGETAEIDTWCSGTGAMWAERRSTIHGPGGGRAEASALWVHLDPRGVRPRPVPDGFAAVYGASADGRHVRARLRHAAAPPDGAPGASWRFRAADLDLAGHVNNAVYWQILEEELVGAGAAAERFDAEIEHRAPADVGDVTIARDGAHLWIAAGDVVLATIFVASA